MKYPEDDSQFTVHRIDSVARLREGGGWSITNEDGWSLFVPADSPVKPEAGMEARFYGKGIGFTVRGLFIDGQKVYYRTEAEQEEEHRKWCLEEERKSKFEFEENRADWDRRVSELPDVFQRRIAKFRKNNPNFRWQYEKYELFCCEQAMVIATALDTRQPDGPLSDDARERNSDQFREALRATFAAFQDMPWNEQVERVPELSDGHSGNTFGCACRLAYFYITDPELVVKMHGALAPLVGSKEYGCVPA